MSKKNNPKNLKTYALCSYRNFRILNKRYKLYAQFKSGYVIKFKYVPDRDCDNEHIYCFIKGKYTNMVKVSDLILSQGEPEVQNA